MHALILNSGGLDSSVCTSYAVDKYGTGNVVTMSLYYGQRHNRELNSAKEIAEFYKVDHIEKDISDSMSFAKSICSLMKNSQVEMDDKSYADQIADSGKLNTEVPLRNGVFLVIAGSIAMSLFPDEEVVIIYGAHSDDVAENAYPDCSVEFADIADKLIQIGSRGLVKLERPLINFSKAEVVKLGMKLNTPFELTTSCYHGGEKACGVCGTCRDRINAFRANRIPDLIEYEISDPFADLRKELKGV